MVDGTRTARTGESLERRSGWIIVAFISITLLLLIPLVALATDDEYSGEPGGETFDLRDDVNDRFAPSIHSPPFVVESRDGDILTQAPLWELYRNEDALRQADGRGELRPDDLPAQPYLFQGFDTDANRPFVGTYTLADAVQEVLVNDPRLDTSLEAASDEEVKLAVHEVLANPETSGLRDALSVDESSETRVVDGREITYWSASALFFVVLADNEKLGGGTFEATPGADETLLDKEEFNRNVQESLRGDEDTYRLWGIALDANLEAADEGREAGVFIMLTVIAALVVVGISLRSYWAVALTGAGLGVLMIWLKGISNLVGIKGGLIIEFIVPIAMISLGVDFAVHALRRYKEEKSLGHAPRRALRVGFAGVLGALALAMLSDGIAFLSNASSGIDAVIGFAVSAAIASVSSFIVLGIVVPITMMRLDTMRAASTSLPSRGRTILTLLGSVNAAVMFAAGVLLLIAVNAAVGAVFILVSIAVTVGIPAFFLWRRNSREPAEAPSAATASRPSGTVQRSWLVPVVTGLARYRLVVLPITAAITGAAVIFATQLDATFDVKDFFDSGSDFVVGLDKLDEHGAERTGERGILFVRGDLTDPQAVTGLGEFLDGLSSNPAVAKSADGSINSNETLLDLLGRLTASGFARSQVAEVTGVEINDVDGDGLPDSREQIAAAYEYMAERGVPLDESTLVYDPGQVRQTLFHDPSGLEEDATIVSLGIPGTREQEVVAAAREGLELDLESLEQNPAITFTGLTGSPFTREALLGATTRTLQTSLPIAAAGVLVLLLVTMRSIRYAAVTIIPIGLVAAWLYAVMHLAGFSLNFVTATIGAVSIGVGIDYSIHMTERFREELRRAPDRVQALRQATNGTGVALLASAASSIVGFAIMGFAPMPLFASYGILTAIMIFLAVSASLVVLPSLLFLATPETTGEANRSAAPTLAH